MKRTTRSLVLLLAAAVLCAPTQAAPLDSPHPTKPADLFTDSVIAKGKDVEVKRSQLDDEVVRLKAQAASQGQNIPSEQMGFWEQKILDRLIQVQLLRAKATDQDKTAGKSLAEKKIEEAKTQMGSEEKLDQQLKAAGTTRDELLTRWTEQATAENVLKRELKVTVSDEEVKKYYEDNPAKFEEPEKVRASHILLMTSDPTTKTELSKEQKEAKHKLMEDILKRARAGEDFAKLAKEFSEDPGSKDKGGEYTFPRGQMVREFEAAAFSLNVNQISDIVTTQFGYHIIKLSEKIPARKLELAKVASELKEGLTQQAMGAKFPEYYAKLKKDANVEILDEKLKLKEPAPTLPGSHPAVKEDTKPEAK